MDGWIHSVIAGIRDWFNGKASLWMRRGSDKPQHSSQVLAAAVTPCLLITEGMQWQWGEFTEWFLFSQALVWSAVN